MNLVKPFRKLLSYICLAAVTCLLLQSMTCKQDCTGKHTHISIINNSSQQIIYRGFRDDSIYLEKQYPPENSTVMKPNDELPEGDHRCAENIYKKGYTQYAYFFHPDTVAAIGWYAIGGTNRGLLKLVKVDSAYLYNNNFSITYP